MRCLFASAALAALVSVCCGVSLADDKTDAKPKSSTEYTGVGDIEKAVLSVAPSDKGGSIGLRVDNKSLANAGNLSQILNLYRGKTTPQVKDTPKDVSLELTPDILVRRLHLPPKVDEKGHKVAYTEKELKELKGDANLRGFTAELSDLKPGQVVTLHVVKVKGSTGEAANKVFVSKIYIVSDGQAPPPIDNNKDKKKP